MLDEIAKNAKKIIPGTADDTVIDAVVDAASGGLDTQAVGDKIKDMIPGDKEDSVVDAVSDAIDKINPFDKK